jgi:hypothetical protein
MIRNLSFLLLALAALSACRPRAKADFSDFAVFYEKFHQDSAFQMAHIQFPMQGLPDNADSVTLASNTFRWDASNWKINKPIDFNKSGFSQQVQPLGEGLVIEKIVHESGKYAMLRRFAKLDDQWYLIYYAGLNPVE